MLFRLLTYPKMSLVIQTRKIGGAPSVDPPVVRPAQLSTSGSFPIRFSSDPPKTMTAMLVGVRPPRVLVHTRLNPLNGQLRFKKPEERLLINGALLALGSPR